MTGTRWVVHSGIALALAGCSNALTDASSPGTDGDGGTGSGGPGSPCAAMINVTQPVPVAGPDATLYATAQPALSGLSYTWRVQFAGVPIDFQRAADDSAIGVAVPRAGVYIIGLDIAGCSSAVEPVTVEMPGAVVQTMRLQIVPPPGFAAPPIELFRDIKGGADSDLGPIGVLSGGVIQAVVLGPAGGVPAYLQFSPDGAPDAIIEAFSDASGVAAVRLPAGRGSYAVLAVPSVSGFAPRRFTGWSPGTALRVDAGSTISGTVLGPADVPLAGAAVRLVSDGVPSTVAVTTAGGSFALDAAPGGTVTVEVTPPDGSGLPRLSATSSGFNLAAPVQIQYSANPGRTDLAGTVVRRKGAAVAGARLTVVGSLMTAGTVTAGTLAVASGEVRVAATADASGALPPTLVPSAVLSAVIEVGPGDLAVTPLDTSGGGAPASLDAPAMPRITTAITATTDGGPTPAAGASLDLVPTGALAMAAAPMLRFVAAKDGSIAAALPVGGRYQLRLQDPLGRGAPLVVADRAITAIASSYLLPRAIHLEGTLLGDGVHALPGASIQLMCYRCSGVDAALPLAGATSDAAGRFSLAVPDPGTR
jgi:hypothetical protein